MSRPLVYFYTANRKRKERHNRARYTRTRPMELRYLVTHTAQSWKTHESGRRVFSPRTGAPVRTAAPSLSVWGGRPADRHEPQLPLELFSLSLPLSPNSFPLFSSREETKKKKRKPLADLSHATHGPGGYVWRRRFWFPGTADLPRRKRKVVSERRVS